MTERLLVYGNCQSIDMAGVVARLPCIAERYEVSFVAWHILHLPGHRWEDQPDFARSRVVLWEQAGEGGPAREVLRGKVPDAAVLRFPPLACTALWPFEMADPRRDEDPTYPENVRYRIGDRLALELGSDEAALALSDAALYDLYLERCQPELARLNRRLEFDRARSEARDRESDIPFTPYVFDNFRRHRLFHDPRHVTGHMLHAALRMMIEASADMLGVEAAVACAELDALMTNHEGQSYAQLPINPLVAEKLGLQYGDAASRIRLNGNSWSFRDYIVNYLRWRPYVT